MRYDNVHTGIRLAHLEPHRAITEDRFFYKEDAASFRAARQELLRTLLKKVPAKVRQADEVWSSSSHGASSIAISNFDSAAHTHDLRGSKIHNCDLMFLAGWCEFALIQYSDFVSCLF